MLQTMMKKMRRNNKKGFTLIELIVVIAILAILAAIMVPSMVGYLNSAKESTANANARTVYSAASSAAAACIASGNSGDVATIDEAKSVTDLKTGNKFAQQIATMLGETFDGEITVTVTDGNVTATTWEDNGSSGSYSVGGTGSDDDNNNNSGNNDNSGNSESE